MLSAFVLVCRRDLLLAMRRKSDLFGTLVFFVLVAVLFPFGVGPAADQLRTIAPGIVWIAALLASSLAQPRLFGTDFADGSLEQLLLTPQPAAMLVLAKVTAHWLVTGLPVLLLTPLLALMFDLPAHDTMLLCAGLLLGTPVLSLIGATGAALTLGARNGAVLAMIVTLPLLVPVLILGAGLGAVGGDAVFAQLQLLGALLAGSLALAPPACAMALRIAVE